MDNNVANSTMAVLALPIASEHNAGITDGPAGPSNQLITLVTIPAYNGEVSIGRVVIRAKIYADTIVVDGQYGQRSATGRGTGGQSGRYVIGKATVRLSPGACKKRQVRNAKLSWC
jgi:hypothetical protein